MNTPNKLTLARIFCVPLFVIAYSFPGQTGKYIAAAVFLIAFLTDIADGYIARKQGIVTKFGKLADPIADKLMMTAALVMLTSSGDLAAYITIIILSREFLVSGLRMVISSEGAVLSASWLGKLKTVSQCVAVIMLLVQPLVVFLFGAWMLDVSVYVALVLTIWSGADYFIKNWKGIDFK